MIRFVHCDYSMFRPETETFGPFEGRLGVLLAYLTAWHWVRAHPYAEARVTENRTPPWSDYDGSQDTWGEIPN